MHCLVYGSPFTKEGEGFTIVGPFATFREARDYAGEASDRAAQTDDDEWSEDFVVVEMRPRHPKDREQDNDKR